MKRQGGGLRAVPLETFLRPHPLLWLGKHICPIYNLYTIRLFYQVQFHSFNFLTAQSVTSGHKL